MHTLYDLVLERGEGSSFLASDSRVFFVQDLVRYQCALPKWSQNETVCIQGNNEELLFVVLALLGKVRRLVLIPRDVNLDRIEELGLKSIYKLPPLGSSERSGAHSNHFSEMGFLEDSTIELFTSGTTGVPKLSAHSTSRLFDSLGKKKSGVRMTRWGVTYDLGRFAGLQVILQAIASGDMLLMSSHPSASKEQIRAFASLNCNAISATPSWWRKALMTGCLEQLELEIVTLGGEIADQKLLDQLASVFPLAKLVHIYASTEAGKVFVVSDKKEGFPIEYLSQPVPYRRRLKVRSSDGMLLIKSPYLAREIDSDHLSLDTEGYFESGDVVEVTGDRVYFKGRKNGAINVGGNKVMPHEIVEVLLGFEGIEQALVRPKKSFFTGSIVLAEIVYSGELSEQDLFTKLKLYCKARLESYKVPSVFKTVNELALNSNGKLEVVS